MNLALMNMQDELSAVSAVILAAPEHQESELSALEGDKP